MEERKHRIQGPTETRQRVFHLFSRIPSSLLRRRRFPPTLSCSCHYRHSFNRRLVTHAGSLSNLLVFLTNHSTFLTKLQTLFAKTLSAFSPKMLTMSSLLAVALPAIALFGAAAASPVHNNGGLEKRVSSHNHQRRVASSANNTTTMGKRATNAKWSYYEVGLGACGKNNVPSDFIVALNVAEFGGGYPGPHCFETITMSYGGKTTTATIMDACPGCPPGGLDLSQGLFEFFAPTTAGIIYGEWNYNNGAPAPVPSSTYVAPTPTSTYVPPPPPSSTYTPPTPSVASQTTPSSSAAPTSSASSAAASSSSAAQSSSDSSSASVEATGSSSAPGSEVTSTTGTDGRATTGTSNTPQVVVGQNVLSFVDLVNNVGGAISKAASS